MPTSEIGSIYEIGVNWSMYGMYYCMFEGNVCSTYISTDQLYHDLRFLFLLSYTHTGDNELRPSSYVHVRNLSNTQCYAPHNSNILL